MLGDMKAVKMLGLTDVLFSIISVLRKLELKTSTKLRKLIFIQVSICEVPLGQIVSGLQLTSASI